MFPTWHWMTICKSSAFIRNFLQCAFPNFTSPLSSWPPGCPPIGPVSGVWSCWCVPPCFCGTPHIWCKFKIDRNSNWCTISTIHLCFRVSPCTEKDAEVVRGPLWRLHSTIGALIIACYQAINIVCLGSGHENANFSNLFAHRGLQGLSHFCQPSFPLSALNTPARLFARHAFSAAGVSSAYYWPRYHTLLNQHSVIEGKLNPQTTTKLTVLFVFCSMMPWYILFDMRFYVL